MDVLPACMAVYNVQAWCPRKPEKGSRSPGTGVADGLEPPLCMLGTKPRSSGRVASALNAEPSLEPRYSFFKIRVTLIPVW